MLLKKQSPDVRQRGNRIFGFSNQRNLCSENTSKSLTRELIIDESRNCGVTYMKMAPATMSKPFCFLSLVRAHVFFCFSQNRQPHTRDQRPKQKGLVLSLRAEYTRLRDQKKHTEHERNAKQQRISVVLSRIGGQVSYLYILV